MGKNRIVLGIVILSVLLTGSVGCSSNDNDISTTETVSVNEMSNTDSYQIWQDYYVNFEGAVETNDNPWGYTAGIIDTDTDGRCLLITPNTAVQINDLTTSDSLELQFMIHPWVSRSSDGAGILIWYLDKENNILGQEDISIDNSDKWQNYEINKEKYVDTAKVKILANNGSNNDDSADWVIIKKNNIYNSDFAKDGYVRSATYFADEWPINFWNSEMDNLSDDLEQIKSDGFDSIIIVIPWREFQPCVAPIEYNDYAFERLNDVMKVAAEAGLNVYARIGYIWDYYNDNNEYIQDRFLNLLGDEKTLEAWIDYTKHLYDTLSKYNNFKDAFLTWEDFWGNLSVCDENNEQKRNEYAKFIGYCEWIKENYTLEEYNNNFNTNFTDYEDIQVPQRNEPAMEVMYKFYDEYLNKLLRKTQDVFPNISMEVRLDADLITKSDGTQMYYSHQNTYECENSDYTATMYGIPMGCENKGEKITSENAMEHTKSILSNLLSLNRGKPVYVEQFLFMDNTPKFSYNAQIIDDQIDDYLDNISDILLQYTAGYGIWTYRDYMNNMIYNNGFAIEDTGWDIIGETEYKEINGSKTCHVNKGDMLKQIVPDIRNHFEQDNYIVSFDVMECEENGKIEVTVGDETKTVDVNKNETVEISFNKSSSFNFALKIIDGDFCIDNIRLYSFIQQGHLYDVDNNEMEYINNIRNLNSRMRMEYE